MTFLNEWRGSLDRLESVIGYLEDLINSEGEY